MARWPEAEVLLDEAEPLTENAANSIVWKHCQIIRGAIVGLRKGVFYNEKDRAYWQTLTSDPLFRASAYGHLGWSDFNLGRWEDAARWWEAGARHPSGSDPGCWSSLLVLRARMGDRAAAEAMLGERVDALKSAQVYTRRLGSGWNRSACHRRSPLPARPG